MVLAVQLDESEVNMKSQLRADEVDESRCKKLFEHFDANKSGEIDMRELGLLIKALGLRMEQEAINNAMLDLDKDNSGSISFEEFWSWFKLISVGKAPSNGPTSPLRGRMKEVFNRANGKEATPSRSSNTLKPEMAVTGKSLSREHDEEVASINGGGSRQGTRQGTWMTSSVDRPRTAASWRPTSQPRGKQRPQTAHSSSKNRWGSDSWRSVSQQDFRPPSSHFRGIPPKLKLDGDRKKASRPMSANPMIRTPPTDPNHPDNIVREPMGSPSGFRL